MFMDKLFADENSRSSSPKTTFSIEATQPSPSGLPHEQCVSSDPKRSFSFCDIFKPFAIYSKKQNGPKTAVSCQADLLHFATENGKNNKKILQIRSLLTSNQKPVALFGYFPENNFQILTGNWIFYLQHFFVIAILVRNCTVQFIDPKQMFIKCFSEASQKYYPSLKIFKFFEK